jgi:macrolide transport system ATP-binding/permease protein
MRYGDRAILADVSCVVASRARIVITGPNGTGKSTLLKIMASALAPDSGRVHRAPGLAPGYLDQEQETLEGAPGRTVYEHYAAGQVGDFETLKTELMTTGLFTWPELQRPVRVLSVGQKRKLQIARLLAVRANVLLLDEPTNHISLDVLEQFEQALLEFAGPIVAISHDRRFIERFAHELWELREGALVRALVTAPP